MVETMVWVTNGINVQKEEGEQEDSPEEAIIRQTDANVGRIYHSLPPDSLLVVCTGQGDTAKTRYAHVSNPSLPGDGWENVWSSLKA